MENKIRSPGKLENDKPKVKKRKANTTYKCVICGTELRSEQEAADHLSIHMAEQAQKQQEAVAHTYLMLAACQLTQICMISAKKPEEIVDMFGKIYELLHSWQGQSKQKEHFVKWLQNQWGTPRES